MRAWSRVAACLLLAAGVAAQDAPELRAGDRLALLGGSLAYDMQQDGWLETLLDARRPELQLTVRDLGFPADEVSVQQRTAGFGTWDDWLSRTQADVVLACFGFSESFAGAAGLPAFRQQLGALCDHLRGKTYGRLPARVVLVTPAGFEAPPGFGPDPVATNRDLALYAQAIRDVAAGRGLPCLDLFAALAPQLGAGAVLRDGVHFTDAGARIAAEALAAGLGAPRPPDGDDEQRLAVLRELVHGKDQLWFQVYDATDGNNVYGGRAPLEYDGVTNATVLQRELDVLEVRADNADRLIHAAARGAEPEAPRTEPPLVPVATNRPGPLPGGAWPFLGGEEAISKMTVGDGLHVSLFASEERFPALAKPVQMSFDTRGRLWVACWPSYPHDGPAQPRADRLLILTDRDGDGVADDAHVFADDLHNPTGFEFWNGGVFVADAPDLLFLKDTDGDDVADVRQVVFSGLSSADTHHTANSFTLGPDGALYFQEGIFHQTQVETAWGPVRNHDACVWRYEPRSGKLSRHAAYAFLNPHGHVFDRWGEDVVTDGTTNENYFAAPLTARVDFPDRHAPYFTIFPQRSRPAGGTAILSSRSFPAEFQGNLLIANVIGFQGVFRYRLDDDGAGLSGTELPPLLSSSDPNFRPVDAEVGPDGAVYVLDWQTPLIGHMQHHLRDPNRDHVHGRVYRVTHDGLPPETPVALAGRPVPELLDRLKDPDDRVRYRAQIELSAHDPSEVCLDALLWEKRLDPSDPDVEHQRLQALWTLQQSGCTSEPLLDRVLVSQEPRARAAAVRVVRQMAGQLADPLDRLAAAVADPDPRVRLEALVALSDISKPRAAELALGVLRHPMDRFLDYALGETMRALDAAWRAPLAAGASFAADDPAGLAWCLSRLSDAELAGVRPGPELFAEQLGRHGLDAASYARAADGLAAAHHTSAAAELLAAIGRADARGDEHADHLLAGLFDALPGGAATVAPLRALATSGLRASTRRLATAAALRADGSLDAAWSEALASTGALGDLLYAAPLLDRKLQEDLFPRLLPLLDGLPPELAGAAGAGTTGRYVRVELPGASRTLTLAEVQVVSRGENVAPRGAASQSSTAYGAVAARAIDGNTSGTFGDGGQTHTQEDQPDPWWELDLGAERPLDAITLWNRSEEGGRFAARLDGCVVRVLDGDRRTVFEAHLDRAPETSVTLAVGSPALRVRGAAARALGALAAAGVQVPAAAGALAARCADDALRPDALAALGAIPPERFTDDALAVVADALLSVFAALPESSYDLGEGRRALALADALAPRLDADRARRLRTARRGHGPQLVVIRPVPDSLQFDRREVTVVAGRPVELQFDNVDIMPHNLVVAASGALARVGTAGEALGSRPDAASRGWVPDVPEVLHATRLLQPGETQTLRFDAPAQPADLPYLCTFPGHWVRMNGVLHVVADASGLPDEPTVAAAAAPSRSFVRDWAPEDLAADVAAGHGDATAGRAVLDAASCLKCHAIDGVGGKTGPDLREVVTRWDRGGLLRQVLRPSEVIAQGFGAQTFFLKDGGVASGRVLHEDADGADVLDDPYSGRTRHVALADVAERRSSEISVMPEGLLSTFSRQDVLDLIAFVDSLRPAGVPTPTR